MSLLTRYLGYILIFSAGFRIVPIIAGVLFGEAITGFIITSAISIFVGYFLIWYDMKKKPVGKSLNNLTLPEAFMLVGMTFLIIPLISSISFLPSLNYNFVNALFESISGYTTTGLTMFNSVQDVPRSLLLWRAETQWIGGIGIVIVFLFMISRLHFSSKEETTQIETTASLYQSQGFSQQMEPSLRKSTKHLLIIYGGYTVLGIFALFLSGMDLFEAISLAFTSISTGGFIVTNFLQVTNTQLGILSVLMLLGSFSFIVHNRLLQKKYKEFLFSSEKNLFILFLLIGIILTLTVYFKPKIVLFELISSFTTTGFSITDISSLPHLFILMIVTGMLVGGTVASTSGGMKVYRVYSLLAMIPWMMRKLVSPRHAVVPLRIKNKIVEEKDLIIITVFVSLFISVFFLGSLAFLLMGYSFLDSSFQVASALGTAGLQTIDLVQVPFLGKLILMLAMLLGRLEIFPLLIIFRNLLRRNF